MAITKNSFHGTCGGIFSCAMLAETLSSRRVV
jgi:hypothetical protein